MIWHKRLFALLATMERNEFKRFGKFLHSPYFTESKGVTVFYDFLKRHHPNFDPQKMDLEANFEALFSGRMEVGQLQEGVSVSDLRQKMRYEKLNHLLSDMYRLLETFFVVEEALLPIHPKKNDLTDTDLQLQARQSNGIEVRKELLAKALSRRPAYELFMKNAKSLINETSALPVKNTDDYWLLSQMNHWQYYHPNTQKLNRQIPGVPEALCQLELCFILSELRYIAELFAQTQIRPSSVKTPFMDTVIEAANKLAAEHTGEPTPENSHPLIFVYNELVRLYLDQDQESRYSKAGELFMHHAPNLPLQEQRLLFAHFTNIGARQLVLENRPIGPEMLSLHLWALKAGILVANHLMTESTFLNICSLAVECGEYGLATDFIQRYKSFLNERDREDAIHAAHGLLCFAKGEFDLAQEHVKDISTNRPPYNFLIRSLSLKIYFERAIVDRSQIDLFNCHAEAFERFIRLQDIDEIKKTAWLNYVQFAHSLMGHWTKNGKLKAKGRFRDAIDTMRYICSKKWLLQKIASL